MLERISRRHIWGLFGEFISIIHTISFSFCPFLEFTNHLLMVRLEKNPINCLNDCSFCTLFSLPNNIGIAVSTFADNIGI